METNRTNRSAILGILLVLAGLLLIAGNFHIFPFPVRHILFSWPMILIGLGIVFLVSHEGSLTGWILLVVGGVFLIPRMFPGLGFSLHVFFWPVLFIAVGLVLIFRVAGTRSFTGQEGVSMDSNDSLDDVAIFGGGKKVITSQNFQGGKITAIFGGSDINFKQAKLAKGKVYIDYVAIFGGTKMIVPEDWDIKVEVSSIFGGFSDKRVTDPRIVRDPSKQLIIKGIAMFGGGDLITF